MIKDDRLEDIAHEILHSLDGLSRLEGIGILETVKYSLLGINQKK